MSHHFAVLKQADLVTTRREGQQIYYALNTTVMQDLVSIVLDMFSDDRNGKEFES
jgi:DNA-binding transcriptional ArsR family regulator